MIHEFEPTHFHTEAGAGPGRFTIELARLGAQVTVSDLSPGQLELAGEPGAVSCGQHILAVLRRDP